MRLTDHIFTRGLVVAALLAITLAPLGGRVLCIDDDGHFAIESAHTAAGCQTNAPLDDATHSETEISSPPADCMDIALTPTHLIRPNRSTQLTPAPLVCIYPPVADIFDTYSFIKPSSHHYIERHLSAVSYIEQTLRSTVLLI